MVSKIANCVVGKVIIEQFVLESDVKKISGFEYISTRRRKNYPLKYSRLI